MSCLFDSLSYFVEGASSSEIRQLICKYLNSNPKLFDEIKAQDITEWTSNLSLQEYTQRMSKSHEWGGAIEIKCFCEIFNALVKVRHRGKVLDFIPSSKQPKFAINLNYTGNHYEPFDMI